jgi:hypothetical protein
MDSVNPVGILGGKSGKNGATVDFIGMKRPKIRLDSGISSAVAPRYRKTATMDTLLSCHFSSAGIILIRLTGLISAPGHLSGSTPICVHSTIKSLPAIVRNRKKIRKSEKTVKLQNKTPSPLKFHCVSDIMDIVSKTFFQQSKAKTEI